MASKLKLDYEYASEIPSDYRININENKTIFNWDKALKEKIRNKKFLDLLNYFQSSEQGDIIHEWIQDEFNEYEFLDFEGLVYQDSGAERRFDAADEENLYEFKTKAHHLFEDHRNLESDYSFPLEEDLNQVKKNLEETEYKDGVLVYIDRETFDVEQYLI
ncbi:MAG: hypothetical protein ABEI78_01025 [Candidatus Nanohaloarchaea archaeon]